MKLSPSFQKDSHLSHLFPDVLWPSQPLWSLLLTYKALIYCSHSPFSFNLHPLPFMNPFTRPLRTETSVSCTLPAPKVVTYLFNYCDDRYPCNSLSISTSSVFSNLGCWCPIMDECQNHLGNFVNWRFLGLTPDLQNQNFQGWGLAIWIFLKGSCDCDERLSLETTALRDKVTFSWTLHSSSQMTQLIQDHAVKPTLHSHQASLPVAPTLHSPSPCISLIILIQQTTFFYFYPFLYFPSLP